METVLYILIFLVAIYLLYPFYKKVGPDAEARFSRNPELSTVISLIGDYLIYLIPIIGLITVTFATAFDIKTLGISLDYLMVLILASLLSISFTSQPKYEQQSYSKVYRDAEDATEDIKAAIARRLLKRKSVELYLFVGSGLDTARRAQQVLNAFRDDAFIRAIKKEVVMKVLVIDPENDPEKEYSDLFDHSRQAIEKYEALKNDDTLIENGVFVDYRTYSYDPVIRGTWVKDEGLFFGFYYWRNELDLAGYPSLINAQKPFLYVSRNDALYDFLADAFENWFDKLWSAHDNQNE